VSAITELQRLDATAQAELVRAGEVSPVELVEAAIERVERMNPALNAVILKTYDLAREAAARVDLDAPFAGVPFLLKDIYGYHAGVRQTHGSWSYGNWTPDVDSELVIRQRKAGLILIGKTNTPEFGLSITTEPQRYGPTRNPWDLERSPGGSSGGAAAAVACGMVPMAHANDGGGSTRIPAACCGVFGLKATRSRNPLRPQFSDLVAPVVSEHVVSRSVRDSAAMLDVTSGPSVGAPYVAPSPKRRFVEEVGRDCPPLRVAVTARSFTDAPVHRDCQTALDDAARLCAELGHHVEEAAPSVDGDRLRNALNTLWIFFGAMSLDGVHRSTGRHATSETVEPFNWTLGARGRDFTALDYVDALDAFQDLHYRYGQFFESYDVLLTPTLAVPPFELGALRSMDGEDPAAYFDRTWWRINPYAPIFNVTGQPAMSVPLCWSDAGLPIGVQFASRFGDEATLFRLAGQLEQARPWAERWPDEQSEPRVGG
jgi:amidase